MNDIPIFKKSTIQKQKGKRGRPITKEAEIINYPTIPIGYYEQPKIEKIRPDNLLNYHKSLLQVKGYELDRPNIPNAPQIKPIHIEEPQLTKLDLQTTYYMSKPQEQYNHELETRNNLEIYQDYNNLFMAHLLK